MYLSINYYLSNIYLYHKNQEVMLCKNNFVYNISPNNKYNKIISLITNNKNRDIISVFESDKIKLNINPMWGLPQEQCKDIPIKKNILIPNTQFLDLAPNITDLNAINCLCQDHTYIVHIPDIAVSFGNERYIFNNWTGNNQIWTSMTETTIHYIYAYLYIFYNHSVLLVSQTHKDPDMNHYFDLDIMSIYQHNNFIQDEYNRIDCSSYMPEFNSIDILYNPPNYKNNLVIETIQS